MAKTEMIGARMEPKLKHDAEAALKARSRGKQLDKPRSVVQRLRKDEPLAPSHRAHRLSGDWRPFREC